MTGSRRTPVMKPIIELMLYTKPLAADCQTDRLYLIAQIKDRWGEGAKEPSGLLRVNNLSVFWWWKSVPSTAKFGIFMFDSRLRAFIAVGSLV